MNNDLILHGISSNGTNKIRRDIATVLESQHVNTGPYLFKDYANLIPIINNTSLIANAKLSQQMSRGDVCTTMLVENAGIAIGPASITTAPDTAPTGSGIRCSLSKDGRYLAVTHTGTSSPAYLVTYKWSSVNLRYEKTNNPDTLPDALCRSVALSRYGDYLAIECSGTKRLMTYKWSVSNLRYELTSDVDTMPTSDPFQIIMSYDGANIGIVYDTLETPLYYGWDLGTNRYLLLSEPPSDEFSVYMAEQAALIKSDMTFDGAFKAVVNDLEDGNPRLLTYLWNDGTSEFELTELADTMPSGKPMDVSMSMDGKYMAVVHQGATGTPYLVTYINLLNAGYAVAPLVDSAEFPSTAKNVGFIFEGGYADDWVPVVVLWTKTA